MRIATRARSGRRRSAPATFIPGPGFALAALLLSAAVADGAPSEAAPGARPAFAPQLRPAIEVARAEGPIRIDGELDDAGWRSAARVTQFSEYVPGDQTEPPVDTDVLVTYDEGALYVAMIAHDDPATLRSSMRARDQMFNDDLVGFMLDTYGDASWYYEIFCNPIGVQGDLRARTNGDEDSHFDIVWESNGRITPGGYQVEIRVPFESLRFPARDEHVWRANFWRIRPRESRDEYSWAAIDRDEPCFACQFGTLTGIRGVAASTNVELLPTFVGFQSGALRDFEDPSAGFDNEALDGEVSLGARYAITSSLAGEATLNPDFSQIESDAAQIDVNTTFALFYPERRPFFQDGSNHFETWVDAVYTRSINDPSVAAKLTGQFERFSVAYVGARDEHSPVILPFEERSAFLLADRSTSNILRVKRSFLDDSFLGALATDRRLEGGGAGTVFGADGALTFLKNYRIEAQGLASRTEEPNAPALTEGIGPERFDDGGHTSSFDGERYWGQAAYLSLERNARRWNVNADYIALSPTFRADNGFVTQNDRKSASVWTGLYFRPNTRLVEDIEPSINVARVWNWRDTFKDEWVRPQIFARFKGQTRASVAYLWSRERFRGGLFPGIERLEVNVNSDYSKHVSGGVWCSTGRSIARRLETPVLGRGTNVNVWGEIKPHTRLVVAPELNFSRLRHPGGGAEIFDGYIVRTRVNYQFTRELFLRLVLQYDDFDEAYALEPLLSYVVNPFTVFYLGSTHAYSEYDPDNDLTQTSRQFFLKLQYLFRV